MPFRQYAPFFKPEELDTLTAAFDAAWSELSAASGMNLSTETQAMLVKKRLAQRILVSAAAGGIRDLDTLKEQALRSMRSLLRLSNRPPAKSELDLLIDG